MNDEFKIGFKGRLKHGGLLEALRKRGWNQSQAAKFIGVTATLFCDWINLKKVPVHLTAKQTKRLVELTGKLPEDLWPDFVRSRDFLDAPKTLELVHDVDARRFFTAFQREPIALPSQIFEEGELSAAVMEVLKTLTPREAKVVTDLHMRGKNLEEVAVSYCVTRERIRQIDAKALRKLRHPSRSRKLSGFDSPIEQKATKWRLSMDVGEVTPTIRNNLLSLDECVAETRRLMPSFRRVLSSMAFGSEGQSVNILEKIAGEPKV